LAPKKNKTLGGWAGNKGGQGKSGGLFKGRLARLRTTKNTKPPKKTNSEFLRKRHPGRCPVVQLYSVINMVCRRKGGGGTCSNVGKDAKT